MMNVILNKYNICIVCEDIFHFYHLPDFAQIRVPYTTSTLVGKTCVRLMFTLVRAIELGTCMSQLQSRYCRLGSKRRGHKRLC